ncbi:MAG TPA: caspase family protein [Streptosporangiaceae bacterium]|nr:caspase family protein [Streptosporangiaceae bacterium]
MTRLHAVLIGINSYLDPTIPALHFARQDAQDMGRLLTHSTIGQDVTVYSLLDRHATRKAILRMVDVDVARSLAKDDVLIFYFAGHGSPELRPGLDELSRFLVCYDTTRESLFASAIDITADLGRLAARLPARLVIFIIDACFSGYGGGRGIAGPLVAERRRLNRPAIRLADLALGSGILYLAACSDDEVAAEEGELGHGTFTYHLLEQLTAPGETPAIGLPTLYDRVFSQVHAHSAGRQNPVLWGTMRGASLPRLAR